MGVISKNTNFRRKKDVKTQKNIGASVQDLTFGHEFAGGETLIDLLNLNNPTSRSSIGLVNPLPTKIIQARISIAPQNVSLKSTIRTMIQGEDYKILSNTRIELLGSAAQPGEVIEGTIRNATITGLRVVETKAQPQTGSLAVGDVEFPLSQQIAFFQNPLFQLGGYRVHRNGLLQARCEGNLLSNSGNFVEVQAGNSNFTTLLQFKNAPVGQADGIIVDFDNLTDNPNASTFGALEKLQGDLITVAKKVQDISNCPLTDLIGATPTQVQIAQFGQVLFGLLDLQVPIVTPWVSFTPSGLTWITNTIVTALKRQVGENQEVQIQVELSGAPNATSFDMDTPSSIDLSKFKTNDADGSAIFPGGAGAALDDGTDNFGVWAILPDGFVDKFSLITFATGASHVRSVGLSNTVPFTFANNDAITLTFMYPAVGFKTTQTLREHLEGKGIL